MRCSCNLLRINGLQGIAFIGPFTQPFQNVSNHFKKAIADLKPSNIMITAAGRVCIIDLGTTKGMLDDRDMTVAGLIVGTPNYIAPEQISGGAIDHRCDIYAFGAVL